MIPISLDFSDPGAFVPSGRIRPPAIVSPAPRQVSFGRIAGKVSPGTALVIVKVGGAVKAQGAPVRGRFEFNVSLPPRDVRVKVEVFDDFGASRARTVAPVYGLPRAGRPRRPRPTTEDGTLARRLRELARGYPGTAAVYVEDLRTRRGAAWNARARFPAASTLKVAIALELLRTLHGVPARGSYLDGLLWKMLVYSNNAAANSLLTWIGGSTIGGAGQVNATLRALGIGDTLMYGGYIVGTAAGRPIPLHVNEQPAIGIGKYTTAWDLAKLHRYVHLAAAASGPAARLSGTFTSADARFLMWILAHVRDPGKLDLYLPKDVPVPHKAGWIIHARHDAGIVFWEGGAFVAAVMTWNGSGVGSSSDVLAGRVAAAAFKRYQQLRRVERASSSGPALAA
jgi:beta-lactamase class A